MKNHDLEKQYKREWYYRNKERVYGNILQRKADLKQWYYNLKTQYQCNRCGFAGHPIALDFHHTNAAEKHGNVSALVEQGASKETILAEIAKCECLCANCHRIHHK